jgi:hypothetical protein
MHSQTAARQGQRTPIGISLSTSEEKSPQTSNAFLTPPFDSRNFPVPENFSKTSVRKIPDKNDERK